MRLVQLTESYPHLSNQVKVCNHHTHDGSEKDGERRNDREERRCAVNELPGLENPRKHDGDYGTPTDVNVEWEDSGKVDSAYASRW